MKTNTRTKRWMIILLLVLAAGSLAMGGLYARGFWDESRAVHIKADKIEPSTLAIGTHLIHLSALTDSLYEIASQSADDSGQNTIYYKSELGGNAWFDITSATSLADITVEGTAVKTEEIEALFFTHHTKSDKVTYDLRTGKAVNAFNIRDPYDLESLEELSPLKMYYDQIIEMEGANDISKRIDKIWQTPLTGEGILEKEKEKAAAEAALKALENAMNALLDQFSGLLQPEEPEPEEEKEPETTQVERMDAQLAALQRYLDVLTKYNAETWQIDKVSGVMAAVDAGRRYQVFVFVEEALNEYMDELSGNADGDTPSELLSALAESIGNVQESLITYGGKMLDEGMTVISNAEYDFSNSLIRHAEADDHAACDGDVRNLRLLGNLQNDIISDRPGELELLDGKLIPNAKRSYMLALATGESAEYRAAVQKKSAQALLNSLIAEHETEVNTRRGELEFLINAKASRMDAQSASGFAQECMDTDIPSYTVIVPKDAFLNVGLESIADHNKFLSDLLRSLELALGGNEMDQLMAEKEELQSQRLQALDNNDLAGAKALEEQINAVEEEIRGIEAEVAAQIAQLQNTINGMEPGSAERAAAESELANLQNSFSDGSMAARVNKLKNEVLDSIPTGSFTPSGSDSEGEIDTEAAEQKISEGIDALIGLMDVIPELAVSAVEEVYEALVDGNADQTLIDVAGQALEESLAGIEQRVVDRMAQLQSIVDTVGADSAQAAAAKEELADLKDARLNGSVVAGVDALKQTVLNSIATGRDRANAAKARETLIGLLEPIPELALPALQEIYDALMLDGTDRSATDTVGQAIGACEEDLADRMKDIEKLIGAVESGNISGAVDDLVQEVLDGIDILAGAEGAAKKIEENLGVLSELMEQIPELALPALEQLHDALIEADADQDLIGLAGQEIEKAEADIEARVADRIVQLQVLTETVDPNSAEGIAAKEELTDLNDGRLDGSVVAGVDALKQTVLDSIATGRDRVNAAKARETLIGLLEPVPELALPALQEIYDALVLDGTDQNATDAVGQAIGAHEKGLAEKIADRIGELENLAGTLAPGSAELAEAQEKLDDLRDVLSAGNVSAGVDALVQDAMDSIDDLSGENAGAGEDPGTQTPGSGSAEADATDALGTLTGLLGTAPELVLPALQEVYNKLLLNGGDQDMIDAIEQAIVDNPYAMRDDMSPEQVRAVAKAWMLDEIEGANPGAPLSGAGGLSRMDDETTLAAIVGMQMYYEQTGDKAVQQVMTALAQEMQNLGNPLVFAALKDGSGEYVPLTAVQALTGRRYVWNKNASLGVLARGSDYYGFTVYSDRVLRDRDGQKTEKMSRSARYQNGIYIPEEYAQQAFGVEANYLPGTSMGCICDESVAELAQEFFSWLMEA